MRAAPFSVRPLRADDAKRLASFLAPLNRDPAHHIGYCGDDEAEILRALRTEWDDPPLSEAFVLAEQEGKLVGALGFDAEPASSRAEFWGPFAVGERRLETAEALLGALRFPAYVRDLELFCNVHNALCAEVAARHGFTEGARTHLLYVTRAALPTGGAEGVRPFRPSDAPAVAALHDVLFPGTYYAGEALVQRSGPHRQLFVAEDAAGVCAYAYAEALPEHGEGSLEFVGVAPRARRRGLGTRLVRGVLAWLFSFPSVTDVRLSVEAEDEEAGALYRRAGFRVRHTLRTFRKRR